jgi:hypothetical protein
LSQVFIIGNIIFRCAKQNTHCRSQISKIHPSLHSSEWYKTNYVLKMLVVLSWKIAKRSWREHAAFLNPIRRMTTTQLREKSFSRITRLHWNIFQQNHSSTTIIKWYNALVSFEQLLVSAGKIAKKKLVLDTKIRVGIWTLLQVRSVWSGYNAFFS